MDMMPSKPRTIIVMGQDLFGNYAMYLIAGIVALNYICLNMCYLIVLGETLASWHVDVFGLSTNSIFASKSVYIVIINIL